MSHSSRIFFLFPIFFVSFLDATTFAIRMHSCSLRQSINRNNNNSHTTISTFRSQSNATAAFPNHARYICHLCGKSYTAKGSLVRHKKFECQFNPAIVTFKCPYCSHESRRRDHLRCHIMKHLKNDAQVVKNEDYTSF